MPVQVGLCLGCEEVQGGGLGRTVEEGRVLKQLGRSEQQLWGLRAPEYLVIPVCELFILVTQEHCCGSRSYSQLHVLTQHLLNGPSWVPGNVPGAGDQLTKPAWSLSLEGGSGEWEVEEILLGGGESTCKGLSVRIERQCGTR